MSAISINQTVTSPRHVWLGWASVGLSEAWFGMLMGMMGMLPMVGMLVGQESAGAGFVVHLLISVFIGAVYGLVAGRFSLSWSAALVGGLINGVVWWVLGALIFMPLILGMNEMVFVIGQPQWMSLVGHILYGLVTALVFTALARRPNSPFFLNATAGSKVARSFVLYRSHRRAARRMRISAWYLPCSPCSAPVALHQRHQAGRILGTPDASAY
jgi:hypothetical protein